MLYRTFLGNTLESYLWFAGILLTGLLFKRLVSRWLSAGLFRFFKQRSYEVGAEEFIGLFSAPLQFLIMVVMLYVACDRLTFPAEWKLSTDKEFGLRYILDHAYRGLMVGTITWMVLRVVDYFGLVLMARARRTESRTDDQVVPFLKEGVKVLLAGFGFMVMLGVAFDLDIVSLVTGLGIGGLAFALAAKETLENLLGSFTIFLDKPFLVGDQVRVGSVEGVVESIGFRSTRIRSLDKMLVTMPNKRMVDTELINDTERKFRRSRFVLGLRYDTKKENMLGLIRDLREYLEKHPQVEPTPTVNFSTFSPSTMDVLVVAIMRIPDRDQFAAAQEVINFKVLELMEKNDCQFAFPTSTVLIERTEEQR